jgi:hypothetical protein
MSAPVAMAPLSRTRPVVDPRIDSLIERADEIAQAWAAALVRARPLERIGELPLDALGRDGPALCAAILRAIQSDDALAHGVAPAVLTGARDAAETAADIEILRGVLWERLEVALAGAPDRTLADTGDRLAAASAGALRAGLARGEGGAGAASSFFPAAAGEERAPGSPSPHVEAASAGGPAVIVDEAGQAEPAPRAVADRRRVTPTEPAGEEIVVRAAQPGEGPAAWIRAIGGQLERHLGDGLPFSVLLAELVSPADRERLAGLAALVEPVLASEIRAGATGVGAPLVTSERPGRWWIVLPGADRHRAERVAERVAGAVSATPAADGSPMVLAVGSASCPHDGADAAALAAHADVGLYAARSLLRRRAAGQAL